MYLRDYQIPAVEKGVEFLEKKKYNPSIIVMPTAAGKSWVIAHTVKEFKQPVIVVQPSKELLQQNYEKYLATGGKSDIFSASLKKKDLGYVTYATIGSIVKHSDKVKEFGIRHLLIDECHLFPRNIEGQLRTFILNSGISHILGYTATAFKLQSNTDLDGNKFSKLQMLTSRSKHGNMFKDIIHITQIQELIKKDYWSGLSYLPFKYDDKSLKVNSTGAEFTDESIQDAYEEEFIRRKIIEQVEAHHQRKHILVFVHSIAEAQSLSEKIENSACIYSGMPQEDRDRTVREFREGKVRVLINVSILGTGFDFTKIDMIVIGRPMMSLALYYQFLGKLFAHTYLNEGA